MHAKEDLLKWYDKSYCLESVKQDGYNLRFVKNQTSQICLESVKQNGHSLRFVKNQTEEICSESLNQDPKNIRYVDIQKYPELYEKYVFMMK